MSAATLTSCSSSSLSAHTSLPTRSLKLLVSDIATGTAVKLSHCGKSKNTSEAPESAITPSQGQGEESAIVKCTLCENKIVDSTFLRGPMPAMATEIQL